KAAAPLLHRLVAANAIIAWSGLSVFAQVTTMCSGTDIRMSPYVMTRVAQAIISGAVTLVLVSPAGQGLARIVVPAFVARVTTERVSFLTRLAASSAALARVLALMIAVSLILWFLQRIRLIVMQVKVRRSPNPSSSVPRRRA
ncbi:MAG: hypothetical protein AB1563_13215, partial [Bacillota bacterium]